MAGFGSALLGGILMNVVKEFIRGYRQSAANREGK